MDGSKFTCGTCNKVRNVQRFSATTINKYRESLRRSQNTRNPDHVRLPRCLECSGGQRHEMDCYKCGVTKGLDAFSKRMRKNPDKAECIDCVQEREDREPDHRIETQEQEIMEDIAAGRQPMSYASARGTAVGQSHPSIAMGNTRGLSAFSEVEEDGWIQPPVEVPEDPRNRSGNVSELSSRVRRLSITSTGTQNTYQSDVSARTTGSQWDKFEATHAPYREQVRSQGGSRVGSVISQSSNPGFAKQRAVKQDSITRAQIQLEREERRKREQAEQEAMRGNASSDDDDSDEDEIEKYGY